MASEPKPVAPAGALPSPAPMSPGSDVSPRTEVPGESQPKSSDYFANKDGAASRKPAISFAPDVGARRTPGFVTSPVTSPGLASISEHQEYFEEGTPWETPSASQTPMGSRKSSCASVSFRPPRNQSLPQGHQKKRQMSPPPHARFQRHVGFDNTVIGEATKNNTVGLTLTATQKGYRKDRRSRTFMVGLDENTHSDYALQYLLGKLVDDGDEIVAVRVIEGTKADKKDLNPSAKEVLRHIQDNAKSLAIKISLEISVGKVHEVFLKMINMYSPSMLIVGTRGRSLGGIQGLVGGRNSFSKYCLQYSPVPVVVCRAPEKRQKKKDKRVKDPTRQSYAAILAANNGVHEADSENSSLYELETAISPEQEAHKVASAIGLPARFDPTIRRVDPVTLMTPRQSVPDILQEDPAAATAATPEAVATPAGTTAEPGGAGRRASVSTTLSGGAEESESSGEEDEGFEVASGEQIIESRKKEKLHQMEMNEAAALKQAADKDDDDDD